MDIELIEKFKNREVKAKHIFEIREIDKPTAYEFVRLYHYLKDAKFFCVYAYGLFCNKELVGCATYSNPQGVCSMNGWFNLPNSDQTILELSRLCMLPNLNGTNATSFLLGNSMKRLKEHDIKAVITLADSSRHIGSIYQVCNFKYYGLSDPKTDLFTMVNGKLKKNPRNVVSKDCHGVWLPRTRKHRYCFMLSTDIKPLYEEQPHPTQKYTIKSDCCYDNSIVYDYRYNEWWTCPHCTEKLEKIDNVQIILYNDFNSIKDNIKQTSDNIYMIDINDEEEIKSDILKNNRFDLVVVNGSDIPNSVKKYLNNCKQCYLKYNEENYDYWEDFGKTFY